MLFFTPKPGHKLNWEVRNSTDGSEDLIPFIAIEAPTGGARSTVRGIVLRTNKAGTESYLDVVSVPERFLAERPNLIEELDGPEDGPYTFADLAAKLTAQRAARKAMQASAAVIAS